MQTSSMIVSNCAHRCLFDCDFCYKIPGVRVRELYGLITTICRWTAIEAKDNNVVAISNDKFA